MINRWESALPRTKQDLQLRGDDDDNDGDDGDDDDLPIKLTDKNVKAASIPLNIPYVDAD